MSNENLKKAIGELKENAKKVAEEAKKENINPKDLLNEEELKEIAGGKTSSTDPSDCIGYECGVHW